MFQNLELEENLDIRYIIYSNIFQLVEKYYLKDQKNKRVEKLIV